MSEINTKRHDWNRDETILACELYFRTSYGQIHAGNPEIIELANLIGRTPASVSLKLSNFASCDPELKKQNKKGSDHAAKLTKEIFMEFSNDVENLAYQAQLLRAQLQHQDTSKLARDTDVEERPQGEYREQDEKVRIGQSFFRKVVLSAYQNQCCITGVGLPSLLTACHIKSWKDSDGAERTNPHNGLCLNEFHHKAFDSGLITINKDYQIVMSTKTGDIEMDEQTRAWFMQYSNQKIMLPERFLPGKDFIAYHNDVVFRG